MTKGKKYRIVHQLETQRVPRVSVMTYLGDDKFGEHQFNARPIAGTQALSPSDILSVAEVDPKTAIFVNRTYPQRKR